MLKLQCKYLACSKIPVPVLDTFSHTAQRKLEIWGESARRPKSDWGEI